MIFQLTWLKRWYLMLTSMALTFLSLLGIADPVPRNRSSGSWGLSCPSENDNDMHFWIYTVPLLHCHVRKQRIVPRINLNLPFATVSSFSSSSLRWSSNLLSGCISAMYLSRSNVIQFSLKLTAKHICYTYAIIYLRHYKWANIPRNIVSTWKFCLLASCDHHGSCTSVQFHRVWCVHFWVLVLHTKKLQVYMLWFSIAMFEWKTTYQKLTTPGCKHKIWGIHF